MQLNLTTVGGTFVTIHDELKGDTEARASLRNPSELRRDKPESPLVWFSDITEGEVFTLVFADGYVFATECTTLIVSSGVTDPRHTCNNPPEAWNRGRRYCPACDTVRPEYTDGATIPEYAHP